ncbi:uncharacterized protein BXZ73DRAFT_79528 [Epithele typhae]|uniref:uncharacterized protein n=1 Tax=Epithele typhae TaxID=378194 RepID=UPI002008049E|nr:uncharacterized protein BXZ73DRAFT_79528 [Epithele typhae]KAH9923468.1 hypothetical protein BXZ73DRAFT_79528 [Epithele typhae]
MNRTSARASLKGRAASLLAAGRLKPVGARLCFTFQGIPLLSGSDGVPDRLVNEIHKLRLCAQKRHIGTRDSTGTPIVHRIRGWLRGPERAPTGSAFDGLEHTTVTAHDVGQGNRAHLEFQMAGLRSEGDLTQRATRLRIAPEKGLRSINRRGHERRRARRPRSSADSVDAPQTVGSVNSRARQGRRQVRSTSSRWRRSFDLFRPQAHVDVDHGSAARLEGAAVERRERPARARRRDERGPCQVSALRANLWGLAKVGTPAPRRRRTVPRFEPGVPARDAEARGSAPESVLCAIPSWHGVGTGRMSRDAALIQSLDGAAHRACFSQADWAATLPGPRGLTAHVLLVFEGRGGRSRHRRPAEGTYLSAGGCATAHVQRGHAPRICIRARTSRTGLDPARPRAQIEWPGRRAATPGVASRPSSAVRMRISCPGGRACQPGAWARAWACTGGLLSSLDWARSGREAEPRLLVVDWWRGRRRGALGYGSCQAPRPSGDGAFRPMDFLQNSGAHPSRRAPTAPRTGLVDSTPHAGKGSSVAGSGIPTLDRDAEGWGTGPDGAHSQDRSEDACGRCIARLGERVGRPGYRNA